MADALSVCIIHSENTDVREREREIREASHRINCLLHEMKSLCGSGRVVGECFECVSEEQCKQSLRRERIAIEKKKQSTDK